MICHKTFVFVLFFLTLRSTSQQEAKDDLFSLNIIHINDFHARYEPIGRTGALCDKGETCIGGYARTVHTVKQLQKANKNSVFFNAGDNFEGTLMYDIGRSNVTSEFLNMMPPTAMTLGTHEFDHGIEGVVPFLRALRTSPVLVANMDSSGEPTMKDLYTKSMIIIRSKRRIGVIGVTSAEPNQKIGNTGNLTFLNEGQAIEAEAAILKSKDCNIIIVISHCGHDADQLLAKDHGSDIDVIVGSRSHESLYTGDNYPTVVNHSSGHTILIVQAGEYGRYVGQITVDLDKDGKIVQYEGAPIFMNYTVEEDPKVLTKLAHWKQKIVDMGNRVVGKSSVSLYRDSCKYRECALGNLFCDAMVNAFLDLPPEKDDRWTQVPIGIVHYKTLEAVYLLRGNITYSRFTTASRFKNILTAFDLRGDHLLEALEFGVSILKDESRFLQVAGLKVTYNLTRSSNRVTDIKVRCGKCFSPYYESFSKNETYRIVAPNDLIYGTDYSPIIGKHATNKQSYMVLSDALMRFIKNQSPITAQQEERIVILK